MSFPEACQIYHSDDELPTAQGTAKAIPRCLHRCDESGPAIPWQVALQQSLPPLHRSVSACHTSPGWSRSFHRTATVGIPFCLTDGLSPVPDIRQNPTESDTLAEIVEPQAPPSRRREHRRPLRRSQPSSVP